MIDSKPKYKRVVNHNNSGLLFLVSSDQLGRRCKRYHKLFSVPIFTMKYPYLMLLSIVTKVSDR